VAQVKLRAERLGGAANVEILAETELDIVCETLQTERPEVCVIDSVQTLYSSELGSAPGSVAQVREAAARLLRVAKGAGVGPILLEVQALVAQTDLAMPRRVATGVDPKRLAMIVAVLARHAGIALGQADVFVNVAGGLRIDEPGADLAIALAIASAARRRPVRARTASFGEIGLTGRLREATQGDRRLEECAKLGLTAVLAPSGTPTRGKIRVEQVETLRHAIGAGLDAER